MTSSETVAAFEDASPEVLRAANRRITTIHGHLQHAERQDDVLRRPCSSQTRECVVIGGSVLDVQVSTEDIAPADVMRCMPNAARTMN